MSIVLKLKLLLRKMKKIVSIAIVFLFGFTIVVAQNNPKNPGCTKFTISNQEMWI